MKVKIRVIEWARSTGKLVDGGRTMRVAGALTGEQLLFAIPDDSAVPVQHLVAQPEVEVVARVVQAGQRVQPDQQRDGVGLAVVMGRRPGRAAPAAGHGRPVRFGDVQIAVRATGVRVRREPADGEAVQSHLPQNENSIIKRVRDQT